MRMRRKEEESKQGQTNNKAKQHKHTQCSHFFKMKMSCLVYIHNYGDQWHLNRVHHGLLDQPLGCIQSNDVIPVNIRVFKINILPCVDI